MTDHAADYLAKRQAIADQFQVDALATLAAFNANPMAFTLTEAVGIVGLDKAIELFKAGQLAGQ